MWNYRAAEYERRNKLPDRKRFVSKETLEKVYKIKKDDTPVTKQLPTYSDLN